METIQQLRRAHRNVVFKTTYKVEKFEDGTSVRHKNVERVSNQTFKSFVEQTAGAEGLAIVKAAHKAASLPRSEAKMLRTRAATAANRVARHKRASGSKSKDTTTTVAATKR